MKNSKSLKEQINEGKGKPNAWTEANRDGVVDEMERESMEFKEVTEDGVMDGKIEMRGIHLDAWSDDERAGKKLFFVLLSDAKLMA